jgi:hypothetical protein
MSHGGGTLKPLKIYVAGKYNDTDVFKVFNNMRIGMEYSVEVFKLGHNPFCPWMDYHYLLLGNGDIPHERLYEASMEWLRVSDAVFAIPGWSDSKGAVKEVAEAERLKMPIYYYLENIPKVDEDKGVCIGKICNKGCMNDVVEGKVLMTCKHGMLKSYDLKYYIMKVNK